MVNKAVVDYFFVELRVEKHFEALRHFLLMEDGEFALSLTDRLFEKVRAEHQLARSLKRPYLERGTPEGRHLLVFIPLKSEKSFPFPRASGDASQAVHT